MRRVLTDGTNRCNFGQLALVDNRCDHLFLSPIQGVRCFFCRLDSSPNGWRTPRNEPVRIRDQLLENSRVFHRAIDPDTDVGSSIGQMIDCHGKCCIRMGCLILPHLIDVLREDLLAFSLVLDGCVALLVLILERLPVIGHGTDDLNTQ